MPSAMEAFYAWSDRKFHDLPYEQRVRTMSEMDPEFASLDPKKQHSLLMQAYQKYYVQKAPPPGPEVFALGASGIDPADVKNAAPPPPHMRENALGGVGKLLGSVEGLSLPGVAFSQAPVPVQQLASVPLPAVPGSRQPTPAVPPPPPAMAPGQYSEAQILEEEPPPPPPSRAPIFAGRSGRVATTPGGAVTMLPNPYDLRQPNIPKPPVKVEPVTGLDANDPWIGKDVNPVSRAINTAALGTVQGATTSTLGAGGGLAQAAGDLTGIEPLSSAGRDMSAVSGGITSAVPEVAQKDVLKDPSILGDPDWWAYQFGQGLGSMMPMLAAGMGTTAAINAAVKSGRLAPALADSLIKWGPSVTGGITEGLQAGGPAYDEAIREGLSPEEARKRLLLIAAGTAVSSIGALKAGVFTDKVKSPAARGLASALAEGVQEGPVQQTWENIVKGRPLMEGQIESTVGGILAGGGAGAVLGHGGGVATEPQAEPSAPPLPERPPPAPMGIPAEPPANRMRILPTQPLEKLTAASQIAQAQPKPVNIVPEEPVSEPVPTPEPAGVVGGRAAGEVDAVPGPGTAGSPPASVGTETAVRVTGRKEAYPAHYAVREAEDVIPSHSGLTFQKRPDYKYQNERDYSDPANQSRVVINSSPANFDPAYLITDNPDAANGPPVIWPDGNVLGGNNRRMILERVFAKPGHPGQQSYRAALIAKAAQFGIPAEQIAGMKNPILVRELDADAASTNVQTAITDFNKVGTASLTAAEQATSDARALPETTASWLGELIEQTGPTATLNDVLTGRSGVGIVNRLVADGVFTEEQTSALIDRKTGNTTDAARDRISEMMLGRLFRAPDQFRRTPPSVRNKLERLIAPLLRVQNKPEWNLIPDIQEAMDLMEYARAHDITTNFEDMFTQQSMFGEAPQYSDRVIALAEAIRDQGPVQLAKSFKQYANDSTPTFFEEKNPEESFGEVFGISDPGMLERIAKAGQEASGRLREQGLITGERRAMHDFADPAVIRDWAVSIAGDVARGTTTFRDWASRMRSVYREESEPALRKIWNQAAKVPPGQRRRGWRPGMALADIDPTKVRVPKTAQKVMQLEDVTRYLDIQTRNAIGTTPDSASDEEKMTRLLQVARPEMADMMRQPYTGATWYSEDTALADRHMALAFPELQTEPNLHILQKAISATMSNNSQPVIEAETGARIWEGFRDSGYRQIPLLQPDGVTNWAAQGAFDQLEKLQEMLDAMGVEGTVRFLTTPQTTRAIKQFRPNAKGLGYLDDVHSGSMVLGPKIGRYFFDIMGVEQEGSTVDKWDARAQYRRLGRLTNESTGLARETPTEPDRKLFMDVHKQLALDHGLPLQSAAQSVVWHYEQSLYRALGMDVESTGRSDGTAKFLRNRGLTYDAGRESNAAVGDVRTAAGSDVPVLGTNEGRPEQRKADDRGTGPESIPGAPAVSAEPRTSAAVDRTPQVPGSRRRGKSQAGTFSLRPLPPKPQSAKFNFVHQDVQQAVTEAARRPEPESGLSKAGKIIAGIGQSFARTYQHLPRKQHHRLIFELKQQEKNPSIASQMAQESLQNITSDLDDNQFEAFSAKMLLDDLDETYRKWKAAGTLPPGADDFFQLAFKLNPQKLRVEMGPLNTFVAADPKIAAALARHKQVFDAITTEHMAAMAAAGHPVDDSFTREKYYRHRVLQAIEDDKAESAMLGAGRHKVPGGRSFLKNRGSESAHLDYSTDYITSTYEVMSKLIADTRKAKFIAWVQDPKNGYNLAPELKEEAIRQTAALRQSNPDAAPVDWRKLIPKTHEEWHPDQRNVFYMTHTLEEKVAQQILNSVAPQLGVTADQIGKAVAIGGQKTGIVMPKEVAKTFNNLTPPEQSDLQKAFHGGIGLWKQYKLLAPWNVPKSQLRNLTGDAENTLGGNHKAFGKVKRVVKELNAYYASAKEGKPQMSADMRGWFERGGFLSTEVVNELDDLRKINHLERLLSSRAPQVPGSRVVAIAKAATVGAVKKTFDQMKLRANQREAILRYANYLEYLEQVRANGKPDSYGRSIPEEVDALESPEDKAYKLSNDLIGAYDEVSVAGQWMRKMGQPFWSFQELNMRGYMQYYKNAARNPTLAYKVGRHMLGPEAKAGAMIAMRVGSQTIKLAALWALAQAWNRIRFPEEEKSLREEIRARPHLVLGRHADGNVRHFPRLGNLPDLAEWIDPEDAAQYFKDVLDGKMNPATAAARYVWGGPVEKLILGANPLSKTLYETALGASAFPNIHNPRRLHDRAQYLADQLSLGALYRHAFGKPVPDTDKSLFARAGRGVLDLISYESDPGLSATYSTMDKVSDWRAAHGQTAGGGGAADSLKSDGLRNMMLSLRLRDKVAFSRYIAQYMAEGGTTEGMKQSIKNLHPLHGIPAKRQKEFRESLSDEDLNKLALAIQFWEETFHPSQVREYTNEASDAIAEAKERRAAAGN